MTHKTAIQEVISEVLENHEIDDVDLAEDLLDQICLVIPDVFEDDDLVDPE